MDSRRSNFSNMSTPLREINKRYSHSPLLSPGNSRLIKHRYCMSDTSSPNSKIINNYSPGPLLTPVNYSTSVSTYIDSKSPGLSARIVQYNNENGSKTEPFISHQTKYGSPGMYPIVHLEKKSLPIRRLPRDSVTMRLIATRESPTPSINGDVFDDSDSSEVSTSSVIKALKEISKKRLLAEDVSLPQSNYKRHCNNFIDVPEIQVNLNSANNSKVDDSTKKPNDEIPCVVDALSASLTSSNTSLANARSMLKRKAVDKTSDVSPKEPPKHVSIAVETQTENFKVNSDTQTIQELKQKVLVLEDAACDTFNVDTHSKVYEASLKYKLTTQFEILTENKQTVTPGSILSPPDKQKHHKNVTFDIPIDSTAKASTDASSTIQISIPTSSNKDALTTQAPPNALVLPSTSNTSEVVTPVIPQVNQVAVSPLTFTTPNSAGTSVVSSSADLCKLTTSSIPQSATSVTLTSPSGLTSCSSPSLLTSTATSINLQMPLFTRSSSLNQEKHLSTTGLLPFGSVPSTEPGLNTDSKNEVTYPSIVLSSTPITTQNTFNKDAPTTYAASKTFVSEPESINKSGAISTQSISGILSQIDQKEFNVTTHPNFNKPGGFKFNLGGSPSGVFGVTNSVTTAAAESEALFSFGNTASSVGSNFGANTKVTSTIGASSIFSTGFEAKSTPSTLYSTTVTSTAPVFSAPIISTTSQGAPNTTSSTFGSNITTAPVFNVPIQTTDSNLFKFTSPPTSALPAPAVNNITQTSSNSNTFKFASPAATAPIFNAPFGASGDSKRSTFGTATTTSMFNSTGFNETKPPTSEVTGFKFAATTTPSGFTAPTAPSGFIAPPFKPTTTTSVGFTSPFSSTTSVTPSTFTSTVFNPPPSTIPTAFTAPTFNISTTTSTGFTASPFSSTTNSVPPTFPTSFNAVQAPNEANPFKFGASTTTATPSMFNKPFNTSSQNQNELGVFKFGGAASTAAPTFSAPDFNFTAPANTSVSKTIQPTFSTTTSGFNTFGSPAVPFNSSGFGDIKTSVPFGGNQNFVTDQKQVSVFGATTQNQNVFGSFNNNAASFGVAAPLQTAPSQPFQFGASTNQQPTVFAFGGNTEPTKAAPSHASSGVFSFGSTSPAFGAPVARPNNFSMQVPAVPNFGAPGPGVSMFSIGTGSSTPKPPRTQLKARRRT